jgi:hypothetical protein
MVGTPSRLRTAAVVAALSVIGAAAAVATTAFDRGPDRAPPPPAGDPTIEATGNAAAGPPELPSSKPPQASFVQDVEGHLVVAGDTVPGSWDMVTSSAHTWSAERAGRGPQPWVWGTDARAHALPPATYGEPVLSFDGHWLAYETETSSGRSLHLLDTRDGRVTAGRALPSYAHGTSIQSVTDDGVVLFYGCANAASICPGMVTHSTVTEHLWVPSSGRLVDVPGYVGDAWTSPAGILFLYPFEKRSRLVTVDAHGRIHDVARIPTRLIAGGRGYVAALLQVEIDPSATSLLLNASPDAEQRTQIVVRPVRGGEPMMLDAPGHWRFENVGYHMITWESPDLFVAGLWRPTGKTSEGGARARCSIRRGRCVLIDE